MARSESQTRRIDLVVAVGVEAETEALAAAGDVERQSQEASVGVAQVEARRRIAWPLRAIGVGVEVEGKVDACAR
jgi:hypothetical protein